LDEKTAGALLKLGIDIIDVSLDAFTKKSYDQIRKKSDFHRVMANLHNLLYLRKKVNPTTKVMVSIITHPIVKDEIEDFQKYWEPLVERVLIRNLCNVGGLVARPNLRFKTKRWPCPQFWKRITVTCKGKYRFCVEDWLNKTIIGDVGKDSIEKIWQGKEYQRLRKLHLEGRYSAIPICRNCTDWIASPWNYGYEYAVKKIISERGSEAD
jgi:MoaA/NifB/PqqE/SkfB family radical SAM enzyme